MKSCGPGGEFCIATGPSPENLVDALPLRVSDRYASDRVPETAGHE